MEQMLLHEPQKEPNLLTPWFWISRLQNCKTITFYCLCIPVCTQTVIAVLANRYKVQEFLKAYKEYWIYELKIKKNEHNDIIYTIHIFRGQSGITFPDGGKFGHKFQFDWTNCKKTLYFINQCVT